MRLSRGDASEIILDVVLENPSVRAISPACRKHVFLETSSCEGGTLAFQARRVRIDKGSRQYRNEKGIAQATLDDAIPVARTHDMPDFASLTKGESDWGLSSIRTRKQAFT